VKSPDTVVVVNCAGRTRSIIGAQSLRNAGLPNPVYALKNGTMGWHLAGFETDRGRDNLLDEPVGPALDRARVLAARVAARFGVSFIDADTLARLQCDGMRTTYLFDVRLPEAFAAGHRSGSLNAPGGQLVQATDTFAPVRNARIVLIDRHGVQAVMTAHWLLQMGWREVFVLRSGLEGPLEAGPVRLPGLGEPLLSAPPLSATELATLSGAVVIDVGESYWYRQARVPGSRWRAAGVRVRRWARVALRGAGRDRRGVDGNALARGRARRLARGRLPGRGLRGRRRSAAALRHRRHVVPALGPIRRRRGGDVAVPDLGGGSTAPTGA
jgi:rhodanese-related sulfurtransferase